MDENFVMLDESGRERNARILNVMEIDGSEYLVYSLMVDEENESVYVKKIIRDAMGEEQLYSIDNEVEREKVFSVVREQLENK